MRRVGGTEEELFFVCLACVSSYNVLCLKKVPIDGANAALAEKFENVSSVESSLTEEMASELKKLWNDPSIQAGLWLLLFFVLLCFLMDGAF